MDNWIGKVGPLLIAEIGGNHEGNFEYALRLTQLAIEADVDFIKYQVYTGDSIVNPVESPDRNAHFKKFELTPEQHIQLAELCRSHGIGYMASVWDMAAFDWIDPYIRVYKVGSGDLTALPFLEKTASTGKPIILSLGLSHQDEVIDIIHYLGQQNPVYTQASHLALLQCTSMYPIPLEDANLAVIPELKRQTGLTIGYSDHTEGTLALETAVAMGAEILEFHFTDTRENKSFRDHKVSLTCEEVKQLKEKIRLILRLQGDRIKKPLEIEKDHLVSFRRALYPLRDLQEGTIVQKGDFIALRPNHGLDAREYRNIIGKKLNCSVKKYQKLEKGFFI